MNGVNDIYKRRWPL